MACRVFDIWCHNIESMAHNLRETIAILKTLARLLSGWSESNSQSGAKFECRLAIGIRNQLGPGVS
jgi:hypothetical protein